MELQTLLLALVCICFLHGDEHLFSCLLAICVSSLKKSLFGFFAHFLIGLFVFLLMKFKSYLYMLNTKPLYT